MNRILYNYSIKCALIITSVTFFIVSTGWTSNEKLDSEIQSKSTNKLDKVIVHIYYATRENTHLKAEERLVDRPESPVEFGRVILKTLLKGPKGEFINTIPKETDLRAFFISPDKIAYVDLTENIADNHSGGIESEMMTIFSIVNTLILNIPDIKAVKIIINGREADTLSGHIDIRSPFTANMILIR